MGKVNQPLDEIVTELATGLIAYNVMQQTYATPDQAMIAVGKAIKQLGLLEHKLMAKGVIAICTRATKIIQGES